ncbi:hypothetical protein FBU30_001377 [Linnemannia zychae]|nr:hypothetical protein FBU30_001377 [Linnemannia zychae]
MAYGTLSWKGFNGYPERHQDMSPQQTSIHHCIEINDVIRHLGNHDLGQHALSLTASHHSALFNFQSLLLVILLVICTCTYVQSQTRLLDRNKTGVLGIFWKAARIGERLSPYVSLACIFMGISLLLPEK